MPIHTEENGLDAPWSFAYRMGAIVTNPAVTVAEHVPVDVHVRNQSAIAVHVDVPCSSSIEFEFCPRPVDGRQVHAWPAARLCACARLRGALTVIVVSNFVLSCRGSFSCSFECRIDTATIT